MADPTEVSYYQVDAFTDTPFRGNPAGVFLLDAPMDPRVMQVLARETNLSETAFVGPPGANGMREVRWFTPAVEVSLCGHAILAVGHVLVRELGEVAPVQVDSTAGPMAVEVDGLELSMTVPADAPIIALPPSGLLRALRCHEAVPVLRSRQVWVVRLSWEKEVEALNPSIPELLEVDPGDGMLGVAVTAPAAEGADFVSRFFAPWVGVPEDPVTGVSHTALGPYWAGQLERGDLIGRQISGRRGSVHLRVDGQDVRLSGQAVTVARGTFLVPRLSQIPPPVR